MDKENKQPLVSVPVITYNSSETVLETLDSIYNQTYPNIELIVSDDCSTDDTVEICRRWIEEHKERFARTELLTIEKNTGVSANGNRAGLACRGEWSKGIAGDDVLLPNCIQDCMDYVEEHPDVIWLFGKMDVFGSTDEDNKRVADQFDYSFFNMTLEEQLYRLIFVGNCLPAPATFVHVQRNEKIGVKDDERIPLLEDWPKWINLIRAGVKLYFVDKTLVKYRIRPGALSTGQKHSKAFQKAHAQFYLLYCFEEYWQSGEDRMGTIQQYVRSKKIITDKWYWAVANRLFKYLH